MYHNIKLPTKVKNILKKDQFNNCYAHLYINGLMVFERKRVKIQKGISKEITICHCIPFKKEINFNSNKDYFSTDYEKKKYDINRMVFHNASLLINGIKHISVYFHNTSENMVKLGIDSTTVVLITLDDLKIKVSSYSFSCSDIAVQPCPTNEYSYNVTMFDFNEAMKHFNLNEVVVKYDAV